MAEASESLLPSPMTCWLLLLLAHRGLEVVANNYQIGNLLLLLLVILLLMWQSC
jgi:hypothetical protein